LSLGNIFLTLSSLDVIADVVVDLHILRLTRHLLLSLSDIFVTLPGLDGLADVVVCLLKLRLTRLLLLSLTFGWLKVAMSLYTFSNSA
jgi:hypothetical protein